MLSELEELQQDEEDKRKALKRKRSSSEQKDVGSRRASKKPVHAVCDEMVPMENQPKVLLLYKYFVMYAVSSFLNPQARSLVDYKLVDALEDVGQIPKYDWCRYVLDKLVDGIHSFFNTPFTAVNSYFVVPLLVFLHQFPLRGEELPAKVPLVINWDTKNLIHACKEVMNEGLGGMLKSSQNFPLMSKRKLVASGASWGMKPVCSPVIKPSDSDVLSFKIPEGMLTDCHIWNFAKGDVPRALSLQFHRNVEIMARVYLAEIQEYLISGKMVGQDEAVVAKASKKVLKDANLSNGVQQMMRQFCSSSKVVPFRHSPRIGPLPSFSIGFDPSEDEFLVDACDKVEMEDAKKKAAAAKQKK